MVRSNSLADYGINLIRLPRKYQGTQQTTDQYPFEWSGEPSSTRGRSPPIAVGVVNKIEIRRVSQAPQWLRSNALPSARS